MDLVVAGLPEETHQKNLTFSLIKLGILTKILWKLFLRDKRGHSNTKYAYYHCKNRQKILLLNYNEKPFMIMRISINKS